jgi:hypothetical protein
MAKKAKTEEQPGTPEPVKTTPLEGASGTEVENPPPAPPKVESPPTEPPAPDAVMGEEQVGADPEIPDAVRELDLIPEATRGEGPRPEGTEPPPPEAADKAEEENAEAKAKQLKADEAAEQEFLTKQAKQEAKK